MKKTMKDIWLSVPEDVEVRNYCEPIDWADFEEKKVLDDKYLIRVARNEDKELEDCAEVFRTGFPVIKDTEFDILFQAIGFRWLMGMDENFNKGEYLMLVAERLSDNKIMGSLIIRIWKKQRNAELVVISIHSDNQGTGLGKELCKSYEKLLIASGIEMGFVWASAEHSATQKLMQRLGYTIRGVIPGWYRIWSGENNYKRTIEVFLQKFYGGAEKMCTQKELDLLSDAEKLVVPWNE